MQVDGQDPQKLIRNCIYTFGSYAGGGEMHAGYSVGFALGLLGKDLGFHWVPKISKPVFPGD